MRTNHFINAFFFIGTGGAIIFTAIAVQARQTFAQRTFACHCSRETVGTRGERNAVLFSFAGSHGEWVMRTAVCEESLALHAVDIIQKSPPFALNGRNIFEHSVGGHQSIASDPTVQLPQEIHVVTCTDGDAPRVYYFKQRRFKLCLAYGGDKCCPHVPVPITLYDLRTLFNIKFQGVEECFGTNHQEMNELALGNRAVLRVFLAFHRLETVWMCTCFMEEEWRRRSYVVKGGKRTQ